MWKEKFLRRAQGRELGFRTVNHQGETPEVTPAVVWFWPLAHPRDSRVREAAWSWGAVGRHPLPAAADLQGDTCRPPKPSCTPGRLAHAPRGVPSLTSSFVCDTNSRDSGGDGHGVGDVRPQS